MAALRVQVGRTEDAAALLLRRLPAIQASLLRGRYLHRLGTAYVKQGRVDEAVFHLQTASELYKQHASADEQCRFRVDLVNVLIEKGDYSWFGPVVRSDKGEVNLPYPSETEWQEATKQFFAHKDERPAGEDEPER